jgi:pterin-4a-carbinolamine dehydratase
MNEKQRQSQVELVQGPLGMESDETDLKAERVQELLRAVPGWTLTPGGRAIDRVRVFTDPGVAEAYATYVARLARLARQAVTIDHAASQVIVTIYGQMHEVCIGELSEGAFDLAAAIG